jgi:hypothetical protein
MWGFRFRGILFERLCGDRSVLNGNISVRSIPGEGATFFATLKSRTD